MSKVLEKIVYVQTVRHLNDCNVIYPRQFGFRSKHSTSDAILNFVGEVLSAFNDNMMLLSVFIDLMKAFDTMSHELIIEKLSWLGIDGAALLWYSSYLSARSQQVVINTSISKEVKVNVGVPQGSLLGILLFQVLINDLPGCLKFVSSILYADDTTIYLLGRSLRFLKCKMQLDLNNLSAWLKSNQLKLNVSKMRYILFNREGLYPNVDLEVDSELIGPAKEFKFLGLTLDSELKFESHYLGLYEKLSKARFLIRSLSKYLPSDCLRILYYAYYHSHLTYCLMVWWPLVSKSAQEMIQKLQKRIVRAVCKVNFRAHCMPLFKREKIIVVQDQIVVENCKLMHRIYNNNALNPVKHLSISRSEV